MGSPYCRLSRTSSAVLPPTVASNPFPYRGIDGFQERTQLVVEVASLWQVRKLKQSLQFQLTDQCNCLEDFRCHDMSQDDVTEQRHLPTLCAASHLVSAGLLSLKLV